MAPIREYRSAGCQPHILAGWIAAALCLLLAERSAGTGAAPWWIGTLWLLSAVAGAGLAAHLQHTAPAGCRLGPGGWTFRTGLRRWQVPLAEIRGIALDPFEIRLADGACLRPPASCLPPPRTLACWIAAAGLPQARALDAAPETSHLDDRPIGGLPTPS